MSAPEIKGWCPGALRPMASGDGLVVRVRPHGGCLSQTQATGLAELAAHYGNGLIDLSARAHLQLRGVHETGHGALVRALANLGLIDPDPAAEARRNILVTPFWQAGDRIGPCAQDLAHALIHANDLNLPHKFGFALDCGEAPVLRDASADIRIEQAGGQAEGGAWLLRPDGSALAMAITPETAVSAALDLARWFLASGGAPLGRGRMKAHLASGARLPEGFLPLESRASLPPPTPGNTHAGQLVALPFGQMSAETLGALAHLAPLRLTPWRMLLLEGHHAPVGVPGLIEQPDDPLLRVVACVGAPACPQALAPVRDLAHALAPHVPAGHLLHVSACAKGCAHPAPADFTLTARQECFALSRRSDHPAARLLPEPMLAATLMTRN